MRESKLTSQGLPRRVAVAFRLKPHVFERLKKEAARRGMSRTALIEQAVMGVRPLQKARPR